MVVVVCCWSHIQLTTHEFVFFNYCCFILKKAWLFVPLSLLRLTQSKIMTQRTVGMSFEHSKIYRKTYARACVNIWIGILCFSSIHLWYKLRTWQLLKLSLFSFPFQVAKAFSKSVWTCYVCLRMRFTQITMISHHFQ